MPVRDILTIPDPRLRERSATVASIDDDIRKLADDMLETVYDWGAAGLAAVQIGVPKRVVAIDLSRDEHNRTPLVFVNPVILETSSDKIPFQEGCLSVPGVLASVERPSGLLVSFTDLEGRAQVTRAEGLLATCLQHEIDHLDGILFFDHLSPKDREKLLERAAKVPAGWRPPGAN